MSSILPLNIDDLLHHRGVESAFDDRSALDVPIERIREGKVREFLLDAQSGLLEETDARRIYRRMALTTRVDSHESLRNVALLFFSDNPEEWFRGARIEVAQFAADASGNIIEEKIFRGDLQRQLQSCMGSLRGYSTKHIEKVADRPEARTWHSYPSPAIEESVVNAIYHRSYEGEPEPTKVYIYLDRMEIISYPGPVPGIEKEHLLPGAHIPPVSARNRRIGELLKELRLAEARGTGLTKIYRTMRLNGSPAPRFDFDEARSYFRITLPIHPGSLGIEALRNAAQLQALGDAESAQEILQVSREALEATLRAPAESSHAWTWFSLGQVLRGLKASPEEIRRAFEQASQLMPDEERFRREIEKL
jgi:ATP-dependent DNA helicase RecG